MRFLRTKNINENKTCTERLALSEVEASRSEGLLQQMFV